MEVLPLSLTMDENFSEFYMAGFFLKWDMFECQNLTFFSEQA